MRKLISQTLVFKDSRDTDQVHSSSLVESNRFQAPLDYLSNPTRNTIGRVFKIGILKMVVKLMNFSS